MPEDPFESSSGSDDSFDGDNAGDNAGDNWFELAPGRSSVFKARSPLAKKKKKKKRPPEPPPPVADEQPKKKKRRKQQSKKKDGARNFILPAIIGLVCVGTIGGFLAAPIMESRGGSMEPPKNYVIYTDKANQHFKLQQPEDWAVEFGRPGAPTPWAEFTEGSARVRIKASILASVLGDVLAIGGVPDDAPDEIKPASQIHVFMHGRFADDYDDYEEGPMEVVRTRMGDSRLSNFTATGDWGAKLKGIRLTAMGRDFQYTVICDCAEADWEVCEAVFRHVALSLSH